VYLLANVFFGAAYVLCGPDALAAPSSALAYGRFPEAFFFSVETFATIGYGHIVPVSLAANVLTTVESFVGLLLVALSTGLVFARFSRPTANIIFSERAVIAPYRGITAFQFRIANARSSQIIQLEARVLFSFLEGDDGVRVFRDLTLERQQVVFFPLAWTVVHAITSGSPLYGLTAQDLHRMSAEFLILLTGVDETWAQTVHTRSSYRADEVEWGARFESVFNAPTPEGLLSIDMRRLHRIERVDATP
jgi:inward rectifier potassium channel